MKRDMKWISFCTVLFALLVSVSGSVSSVSAQPLDGWDATVCPATDADTTPPEIDPDICDDVAGWRVDAQSRHIWAFFDVKVPNTESRQPKALFVSAKAASLVYLNGVLIGENGQPADTRENEKAGAMDRVYPLRDSQLLPGTNTVAVRMSAHRGPLRLMAPTHGVFVTDYISPQDAMLRGYWPSILPFGAFILGSLYFLTMALSGRQIASTSILAALSLTAAVQLLIEVSRGLVAYPYWFHDWRLIGIAYCSALFGLLLVAYVTLGLKPKWRWWVLGGAGIITLICLILPYGYDAKASFGLLAPTLIAAATALSQLAEDRLRSALLAAALLLFALINFIGRGDFLDAWFYYAVAALLVVLFAQQAAAFARETQRRREEQAKSEKLQYVLDQLSEAEASQTLTIKSAGKMNRIEIGDIAFIRGAGDYAELVLKAGSELLHSLTMAELEKELPSYFLRVHRSYIVNSKLITRLERTSSGTGELFLSNDTSVPVSRRIMPSVREALA